MARRVAERLTHHRDRGVGHRPFGLDVERPDHVRVRALNERGETFELDCEGLLAVCVQHEMDHLMGRVFVEYLSPLKQTRIKTKMKKLERAM